MPSRLHLLHAFVHCSLIKLSVNVIVGFCHFVTLWDYVLWDIVVWDFVCGYYVLWDFVLWDSDLDS